MQTSNLLLSKLSLIKLFTISRILVALLLLGGLGFNHLALSAVSQSQRAGKQVVASASSDSVRFASFGELIQMRLEVISSSGEVLFDSDFKSGNVIDWSLADNKDQRLAEGSYLCLVTVKDRSGSVSRKQAIVTLHDQSISLKRSDSSLLSTAQADRAGPVSDDDVGLTILEPEQSSATAVIAHDGSAAHLVSGSGGLSISGGDFFANKLLEHMRITADGNVGIGVANPQAKLDVAGSIRASQGIVFPDGTIQYSASSKTLGAKSSRPDRKQSDPEDFQTQAAGTGTLNRIAKWLETGGAGALGDSVIAESAGNIGIGTTSPARKLEIAGTGNVGIKITDTSISNAAFLLYTRNSNGTLEGRQFSIFDENAFADRLVITSSGRIGIGTTSPSVTLDVAGHINTSTHYSIGGVRTLSAPSFNTFVGKGAGTFNTGDHNTFVGYFAGISNDGTGNSFFGTLAGDSNSTGSRNSYFGDEAGQANSVGNDNSFFGYHAGFANTASNNSFFGYRAGDSNTSGGSNSFFGTNTGGANTTGNTNAFFGYGAGIGSTTGHSNTFVGALAGTSNTTGSGNTYIGGSAGGGSDLTNATAIGNRARVTRSNSMVLGSINGINGATADTYVGIGTTNPIQHLEVKGFVLAEHLSIRMLNHASDCVVLFGTEDGDLFIHRQDCDFNGDVGGNISNIDLRSDAKPISLRSLGNRNAELADAIKKQQAQIAEQQRTIEQQQTLLKQQQSMVEALKQLVCQSHPKADVCKQ